LPFLGYTQLFEILSGQLKDKFSLLHQSERPRRGARIFYVPDQCAESRLLIF